MAPAVSLSTSSPSPAHVISPCMRCLPLHASSSPALSHLVCMCVHTLLLSHIRVCACVYAQCCSTMMCCVACLRKHFHCLPMCVRARCWVTRHCHACAARHLVCACHVLACVSKLEDNASSGECQWHHVPVLCVCHAPCLILVTRSYPVLIFLIMCTYWTVYPRLPDSSRT